MSAASAPRPNSPAVQATGQDSVFRYLTSASRLVPLAARYGIGQGHAGTEEAPGRILGNGLLKKGSAWKTGSCSVRHFGHREPS